MGTLASEIALRRVLDGLWCNEDFEKALAEMHYDTYYLDADSNGLK